MAMWWSGAVATWWFYCLSGYFFILFFTSDIFLIRLFSSSFSIAD
jgi:hypothetical protein